MSSQLALGQLGPLVEEVDALGFGRSPPDALAVVAVEIREPLAVVVDALEQLGRLGVSGDGRQRLAQGRDGVFGVAGLLAPARDLVVDGRRAVDAVGADPVRVGVDRRPAAPAPFRRADAGEPPRPGAGRRRPAPPASRPAPAPGRAADRRAGGRRWSLELQLVKPHDGAVVAERAVDLARRLDRADVLVRQLAGPLRVAHGPLEAREVVHEQLAHLGFAARRCAR